MTVPAECLMATISNNQSSGHHGAMGKLCSPVLLPGAMGKLRLPVSSPYFCAQRWGLR